ncbi:cbb3-type cytochrome oxidase assembly protein CcoS [Roseospira visakhapatnamensis]|uniref:Cbb3-type cytochrome oxidase maturation protein n=1 Tax=Roseospira visakhapatnamensis TaxID=390880 RepID=A0A7W6RBU2_9PROT|nr:cbb3-type cytochrome oxidase assembly protein CcoS [Roseospira visakhapatnamensis]MBB4265631.1 cbb3-type cytochrome oxidase maturation protein [Roseospira visakhapatnamensis]
MNALLMLIPLALLLGLLGLAAFLWALRSGQFDDMDGAAHRILFDDDDDQDGDQDGDDQDGDDGEGPGGTGPSRP